MSNLHTFFNQLSIEMDTMLNVISDKSLNEMKDLLEVGAKQKKESFDIGAILSAAFSIVSAATGPSAPVSGLFAGVSGVMSMISANSKDE